MYSFQNVKILVSVNQKTYSRFCAQSKPTRAPILLLEDRALHTESLDMYCSRLGARNSEHTAHAISIVYKNGETHCSHNIHCLILKTKMAKHNARIISIVYYSKQQWWNTMLTQYLLFTIRNKNGETQRPHNIYCLLFETTMVNHNAHTITIAYYSK